MNIERVNSTLVMAIEHFQAAELEDLWEFNVPSPHEMHRKHGMALPADQFVVPSPAQMKARSQKSSKPKVVRRKQKAPQEIAEISQEKIRAGAVKSQADFNKVFAKLKPRQVIWIWFDSPIARGREYVPFVVGRRSYSKKYDYHRRTLLHKGQTKPGPTGMQTNLYRRGDGPVGIALGDLAATLRGIYVAK